MCTAVGDGHNSQQTHTRAHTHTHTRNHTPTRARTPQHTRACTTPSRTHTHATANARTIPDESSSLQLHTPVFFQFETVRTHLLEQCHALYYRHRQRCALTGDYCFPFHIDIAKPRSSNRIHQSTTLMHTKREHMSLSRLSCKNSPNSSHGVSHVP